MLETGILDEIDPIWTDAAGPECDVVVSTRARLARNLSGFAFPGRAAPEDLEAVAARVRSAALALRGPHPGIVIVDPAVLSEEVRGRLVDAHLVSPRQVRPRRGGLLLLEPDGRIAIMVNEEDHLRVQAILPGLQVLEAWSLVDQVDDILGGELGFAYSEKLGFLTASPSNLGTGLRVSAMMHLAGLAMTGRLAATVRAALELDISVRGLFGEGSTGLGDFYQVSNEVTLGVPETEFAARVRAVAEHLVREERLARDDLLEAGAVRLMRAARRSMAALREAETVGARDALMLLSPIRLAVSVGRMSGLTLTEMNGLLVTLRVARLEQPGAEEMARSSRRRAVQLRRVLRGVTV